MEGKMPVSLLIFFIGCFTIASAFEDQRETLDTDPDTDFDKRPLEYMKKPYHYLTEYKRLPLYNFGLGKRSLQYGFGLGKRYSEEEGITDDDDYPFAENWPESDVFPDAEDVQVPEKRQKVYSFGLGKRVPSYDFGLGKRTERVGSYGFGLGKRTQKFTFGLGKRDGVYSFGLGKRASDSESGLSRFGFGLGKRFDDSDSDGSRNKRETTSSADHPTSPNMNPAEKDMIFARDIEKRSKNSALPPNNFSRRNRKPLSFDFGLGKRIPHYDFGVGKRNYPNDDDVF